MPRPTLGSETSTGPTKNRNVKVQPELWAEAWRKAMRDGFKLAAVIRGLLRMYVEDEIPLERLYDRAS